MLSLFCGIWGISWGILWPIESFYKNFSGGILVGNYDGFDYRGVEDDGLEYRAVEEEIDCPECHLVEPHHLDKCSHSRKNKATR